MYCSFHYPRGPGCFCGSVRGQRSRVCDLLASIPGNQMEKSGVSKEERDYFLFIKYMCKSSSGAARRPTGNEGGCSRGALMCECVGINQCENGIFWLKPKHIFNKMSKINKKHRGRRCSSVWTNIPRRQHLRNMQSRTAVELRCGLTAFLPRS